MRRRWIAASLVVVAFGGAAAVVAVGARRARAPATAPVGGAAPSDASGDASDDDAVVEDARRYPVRRWGFAIERTDLRIEDVHLTSDLAAVLAHAGADLVVNGGFFDTNGRALGLTISDGVKLSPFAPSLSGGVLTIADDVAVLHETESFGLPSGVRFAVQCRPRLVVRGAPNVKRDDGKRSERTALCLRDAGRTIEVVVVHGDDVGSATGPSLHALAGWLARRGCEDALNLDGGPSTGAAWRDASSPEEATHVLAPRGPVRHAIAFVRR